MHTGKVYAFGQLADVYLQLFTPGGRLNRHFLLTVLIVDFYLM